MDEDNQEQSGLNKAGNRRGMQASVQKNLQKAGAPGNNPKGRPVGSRDRASVIRELMDIKVSRTHPKNPMKKIRLTLYEAAALGQFLAAEKGNTFAWKEIQDTLHGPMPAKVQGQFDFSFASLAKAASLELNGGQQDDAGTNGSDINGNGHVTEEELARAVSVAGGQRSEDDCDSVGDAGANNNHGGEVPESHQD